ncbi:MAG: hypothetical protein KY467_18195 [Gemmatimonadetes bacterium]|nr:hypothetical protein [Gemmatimonadota bacterium]
MKHGWMGALCAVLALPACGGDNEEELAVEATDAVAVRPAPGADTAQQPATGTPGEPVEGGAELTVGAQEYGEYIADQKGRPLYMFTADSAGQSNCYDRCAQMWPPLLAPQGTPTAGSTDVRPRLIGTVQRRDGAAQVTYGGHPLYYYHKDQGADAPRGQDVHDSGGEWYLVTPAGQKLENHGGGS